MSNRIGGGWRGSAYLGTKASQPPEIWVVDRDPTPYDTQQYSLLDFWLNSVTDTPWMLVSLKGNSMSKGMVAEWIRFGQGDLQTLTGDTGGPIEPINFNINIIGAPTSGLVVNGNPGTATLSINTTGGGGVGQDITGNDNVSVPFDAAGNIFLLGLPNSGITTSGNAGLNTEYIGTTSGHAVGLSITNQDASVVFPDNAGNWNFTGAHGLNTTGNVGANRFTAAINNTITLGDLAVVTAGNDALTITSGNITLSGTGANAAGNINMPATTADERQGEIVVSGHRFMSNYGTHNTFLGQDSGSILNIGAASGENVGIGSLALNAISNGGNGSQGNVAVGSGALSLYTFTTTVDVTGGNTAIGTLSQLNLTTGGLNTSVGWSSLSSATTAANNTVVGGGCLSGLTTGTLNTAIGHGIGINPGFTALLTGTLNILIGNGTASAYAGAESSNILINNPGVVGENNTTRIGIDGGGGGAQNRCFIAGIRGITTGNNDAIAVLIDSAGQLGTVSSSIRFKEDVNDMGDYSDDILRLRPVTFHYKNRSSERISVGLIAEEVGEVMPDLVVFDDEGFSETVRYQDLVPLLLNELQKAVRRIDQLEKKITKKAR